MHENISDSEDCVTVTDLSTPKNATDLTYESIIDLSDSKKKLKANAKNSETQCPNEKTDDNEKKISAADKVKAYDLVTKENVETGKINTSAWSNLKWSPHMFTNRHALVKHKLPLVPPPERGRNKTPHVNSRKECQEQKKQATNVDTQTDTVYLVTEEDYDLIQYMKSNGITKEMLSNIEFYDEDVNNNLENQPEFEQVSIPLPEVEQTTEDKGSGEEKEVNNLIEKYSDENKAMLSNFFGGTNNKATDLSTDPTPVNKSKDKNFFEYIHSSLWQLVICMSNYKEIVEKDEKLKAFADKSTQTEIVTSISNKREKLPQLSLKDVRLSKPNVAASKAECNAIGQKEAIQRFYQTLRPAPAPTPRAPQPRAPRQLAQQKLQEPPIKRPRPSPPDMSHETVDRLNNSQMQLTNVSTPRWRMPASHVGGEWRLRYSSNVARPQWYSQMGPPMPPPPPPPQYNQDHRFASQNTYTVDQFQSSLHQQEMAEYQKYQQMEMQKKAWESQLKNYPNSAWSRPMPEN